MININYQKMPKEIDGPKMEYKLQIQNLMYLIEFKFQIFQSSILKYLMLYICFHISLLFTNTILLQRNRFPSR